MSRNYKFHNPEGLYFISFATVFWIDVFVRRLYFDCIVESLNHCVEEKGMEIYHGALCRVIYTWFLNRLSRNLMNLSVVLNPTSRES